MSDAVSATLGPATVGADGAIGVVAAATDVELIADHVRRALDRRCEQFKFVADEED